MYGPRLVKTSLRRRGGTLSGRELNDVEQFLVKMKERFKILEEGRRRRERPDYRCVYTVEHSSFSVTTALQHHLPSPSSLLPSAPSSVKTPPESRARRSMAEFAPGEAAISKEIPSECWGAQRVLK